MARAPSSKGVVSISNVAPTVLLMKKYGSKFNAMVRDDVQRNVAPMVVTKVSARARSAGRQGPAVAGTFKATRDRFPAFRGFGATRVTSGKVPAGNLGFGANWGAGDRTRTYVTRSPLGRPYRVTRHTTRQFGPWTGGGSGDRFIYSTIAAHQKAIEEEWQNALDRVYKDWNR